MQERDILACVKERDVLAGVQERDILTGTPPDWRYCQINSIIIDYREQSVLIEWVVWANNTGACSSGGSYAGTRAIYPGVCARVGYPGGCARALDILACVQEQDILASVQGRDILTGVQERDTLSCVQERDILACVKERDVLAGVQERDILTGTPQDWRYCEINSIIIDYREQSVLIEWVVWV